MTSDVLESAALPEESLTEGAKELHRIALLGAPNSGKTSLFNALTGRKAKVANYPGVTVEYSKGLYSSKTGQQVELLDLPGVYGDCGHSADERVTLDAINGRLEGEKAPSALIVVMDASRLRTHLHNVLQAKSHGLPMILVLNMMDIAARDGVQIDVKTLSKELGIEVVTCVAVRAAGRAELEDFMSGWIAKVAAGKAPTVKPVKGELKDIQKQARKIADKVISGARAASFTQRLDKVLLHPVLGPIIFALIMFFMFQSVFAWAGPFMDAIEGGIGGLGNLVGAVMPDGWVKSLIVDGIIGGVGSVLVFLPQIIILFAFILALEASGYMARAAFLMDTLMAKAGLSGRAFIPLLSSFACAIPGIMSARTIENERDRLTTILIAPMMTCSARLPVYALLIGAFFNPEAKVGIFNVQGLVLTGLYVAGIIGGLCAAFVLKKTVTKGPKPALLMELPGYKLPTLKDYLMGLWTRAWIFIRRAGVIIFPASVLMWFLSKYPNGDAGIEHSFAGYIGSFIQPVLAPIGFNLEMAVSVVPAMAAREIAVATLGTVYAISEPEGETALLANAIAGDWTVAMALAFLAWFVFAPQCLATLAVMKRETNSWKWPGFAMVYLFVLAWIAAFITYRVAIAAGLG